MNLSQWVNISSESLWTMNWDVDKSCTYVDRDTIFFLFLSTSEIVSLNLFYHGISACWQRQNVAILHQNLIIYPQERQWNDAIWFAFIPLLLCPSVCLHIWKISITLCKTENFQKSSFCMIKGWWTRTNSETNSSRQLVA